ncbi:MAG TPA: phage holin family protein [Solirubrobacter sp.]|nr:phage holin family protein [Solirubrobacter sp.]
MASPTTEDREQSIAQLFRELSQESAALVRDELTEQGKRVGASAGLIGAAAALGAGAFAAVTAGLVSALGRGRTGRGAVAVAVLYGAGAAGLAMVARDRLREVAPQAADTAETVKRDVQAAAEGASAGGST